MHSLLAKGRLLYTHDETIAALCARLHLGGERDTRLQLLAAATRAAIHRQGPQMVRHAATWTTALWILYAAIAGTDRGDGRARL
jgi:hypothetical protein